MERIRCKVSDGLYAQGRRRLLFCIEGTDTLHQNDNDMPSVVVYDNTRNIVGMRFYRYGKLHRDDNKPAYIHRDSYGSVMCKWYQHANLHRENDEPAWVESNNDGLRMYRWYTNGKIHRGDDKPADIHINNDNKTYEWYIHGIRHRDGDQPASILEVIDGHIYKWFKNGDIHRDGIYPAYILESRLDSARRYHKNGKNHRINGPATIYFDKIKRCVEWAEFHIFGHVHYLTSNDIVMSDETFYTDGFKTFNPMIGNRILQFISNMKLKMRLKKEQELLSITNILSNDSIDQLMSYIS